MSSTVCKYLEDYKEIVGISELIKDRLYFVTFKNKSPEDDEKTHFFTEEVVRVSLASIARYVQRVERKLSSPSLVSKTLVYYSCGSEKRRGDAAVLAGSYCILRLNMDPDHVSERSADHTTTSFKDAFNALQKAIRFGIVDFEDFNVDDFETLEKISVNWVIPRRLILFTGPLTAKDDYYLSPKKYLRYFKQCGVKTVVRLWHNKYDANPFVDCDGMDHYDLSMEGTTATDDVLECFLEICERSGGPVVIHCRELMGRAGSLAATLLVKHYRMTAAEAAAWIRFISLDRLLESQKKWLRKHEESLRKDGDRTRATLLGSADSMYHHERGIYSYKEHKNSIRDDEVYPRSEDVIDEIIQV